MTTAPRERHIRMPQPRRSDSDSDSVQALLQRVGQSDQAAFAALYDQYAAPVFGMTARIVRDAARLDDLVLDVWLHIWQQAPRYIPAEGSAGMWLMTLAHHHAVERVRSIRSAAGHDGVSSTVIVLDGDPVARPGVLTSGRGRRWRS